MNTEQKKNSLNSSRSKFLDVVKALAILWIAWYHVDQLMLPKNQYIFNIRTLASFGFAGVNVFLLLSGFGLTLSMSKVYKNSAIDWNKLPWKKFFARRLLRIYPLYIIAHILFFITGALLNKYADMPLDIGFFLSITGLRVFFPKYFWYGPDAFWFVGLIIQFYFLFPFLFWLLLKFKKVKFFLITFIICGISRLISSELENHYILMLGLASNRLAEFCLGMLIGYSTAIDKILKINNFSLKNKLVWISFFLSSLLGVFIYWQPISLLKTVCIDLVLAAIFSSLLIIIALIVKRATFIYAYLYFIGTISYSFYLFHSPPIRPIFSAFKAIGINSFLIVTFIYLFIIILLSYTFSYLESLLLSSMQQKKIQ